MRFFHFESTVGVGGGDSTVGDSEPLSEVAYLRYLSVLNVLIDDIVGDLLPGTSVTDLILGIGRASAATSA
jgi:hypothetical protein